MKQGITGVLLTAIFLILAGCGTKQVAYEEEKSSKKKGSEVSQEESAGTTLMETLGVEEEWKERINLDNGKVFDVAAKVLVPDVSRMSLMEVSEYYYTPEDKKRTVEYFLDGASIQVNVEMVSTKENIEKKIKKWDKVLELSQEQGIEEHIEVARSEKKKLEDLLNETPKADEIELSPGNYKENHFVGLREGKEYTLDFDINEEEHISQWILAAKDYKEFNETAAQWWASGNASDNKCTMAKEEAEKKAVQICKELGITGMVPAKVDTAQWGDQKENNGYCIVLGRENAGVVMEPITYSMVNEMPYRNTELGGKTPYEQEIIEIGINDNGIFWMRYSGVLSVDKEGTEVKLLSFDHVKEAFIKEIISKDITWTNMESLNMKLIYFRFMDEKMSGKYTYIPVWRLMALAAESGIGNSMTFSPGDCIFINAIDGSPVDIDKEGGTYYMDPESLFYLIGI